MLKMMSMLNQAAVEALCSATYLENYLDCMENLPDDLQRIVTQLRELDSQTSELVQDVQMNKEVYLTHEDGVQKKRALIQIQRGLIKCQEIGDEKLSLVAGIIEHIESRTRLLEQNLENLDPAPPTQPSVKEEESTPKKVASTTAVTKAAKAPVIHEKVVHHVEEKPEEKAVTPAPAPSSSTVNSATKQKRQRRQRQQTEPPVVKEEEKKPLIVEEEERPPQAKKKKKRKAKKEKSGDKSPVDPPIDPDEPTYCLCEQVSYGEMIGCDNDKCVIEWFHFNCVQLSHKPKGKWFCPKCRGDKPTVMRVDLHDHNKKDKSQVK